MSSENVIAKSSITRELRRRKIFIGTAISLLGMLILLISGVFLPVETLKIWGFPLLLLGGMLVTIGLLPYRQMTRLEMNPYEWRSDGENGLILVQFGKKILSIPISSIKEVIFIEEGMGFILDKSQKVTIFDKKYQPKSINGKADLYFPYFTKRAVKEVEEFIFY